MEEYVRIFGYGSLINENSLKKTVPNAKNIVPVKLCGYKRVFDLKSCSRKCSQTGKSVAVLNIVPDLNHSILGVIFEVPLEEFDNLKEREKQYELEKIIVVDIRSNEKYESFTFIARDYESYSYTFNSQIQNEYLKICIDGCLSINEQLLENFLETTYINNKTLKECEFLLDISK